MYEFFANTSHLWESDGWPAVEGTEVWQPYHAHRWMQHCAARGPICHSYPWVTERHTAAFQKMMLWSENTTWHCPHTTHCYYIKKEDTTSSMLTHFLNLSMVCGVNVKNQWGRKLNDDDNTCARSHLCLCMVQMQQKKSQLSKNTCQE